MISQISELDSSSQESSFTYYQKQNSFCQNLTTLIGNVIIAQEDVLQILRNVNKAIKNKVNQKQKQKQKQPQDKRNNQNDAKGINQKLDKQKDTNQKQFMPQTSLHSLKKQKACNAVQISKKKIFKAQTEVSIYEKSERFNKIIENSKRKYPFEVLPNKQKVREIENNQPRKKFKTDQDFSQAFISKNQLKKNISDQEKNQNKTSVQQIKFKEQSKQVNEIQCLECFAYEQIFTGSNKQQATLKCSKHRQRHES